MQIIRYILASFAMFSAIPVKVILKKDDFKYTGVCLPLVGALLGIVLSAVLKICIRFDVNNLVMALIIAVFPVIFTGGIHLDGFMDCHDAFASHSSKERMLEIMKDSNTGAFACIYIVLYELSFFVFCFLLPKESKFIFMLIVIFSLSRAASAFALLSLDSARSSGMGKSLKDMSDEKKSRYILIFEMVLIILSAFLIDMKSAIFIVLGSLFTYLYCTAKMKKQFSGITGDLAGWFLSLNELVMLIALNISAGGIF